MSKDWLTPQIQDLCETLAQMRTTKEIANFMRDVATIGELTEMAKRWQAAQALDVCLPYKEIAKETGLSTTTVTRVAYWLNNGEGGYRAALKNHHHHIPSRRRESGALKRK